jgi:hypothetical protein
VHILDKARAEFKVVILDADRVALLQENVSDLARNGGHRAPTAQKEVVTFTGTAWHRSDLPSSNGHAEQCGASRMPLDYQPA